MSPWWSERWLAVLDAAGPTHARRVQRGRAAARRGTVEDLEIVPGEIRGRVREDRVSPYRVRLAWPVPTDATWERATERLGGELRFTAALLDGELPEDLGDVLAEVGIALTPSPGELERTCTCTERADWCRHVAAVHAAAGSAFARDPFLLLRLRGRSQEVLLRALRTDRGGAPAVAELDLSRGFYAARADLDEVAIAPHPVEDPAALLGHLGDPPGVDDPRTIVRIIERSAATAWRLAAGAGAAAADEELLLAELRAQRTATVASLADALARDEDAIRAQLDELFEAGTVLRTGAGDTARYRAP